MNRGVSDAFFGDATAPTLSAPPQAVLGVRFYESDYLDPYIFLHYLISLVPQ